MHWMSIFAGARRPDLCSMDIYHVWCDPKPGVGDVAFAKSVAGYMGHLKEQG